MLLYMHWPWLPDSSEQFHGSVISIPFENHIKDYIGIN